MSNKRYMCILRSGAGGCEKPSPSDMEAMYAKYQAWQDKFADNILDMGGALSSEGATVRAPCPNMPPRPQATPMR